MLRLQKWGNSAAVRLPARLLTALNAKIGDALETEIRNGELLIRPVKRYRLSDLLAETEAAPPRPEHSVFTRRDTARNQSFPSEDPPSFTPVSFSAKPPR